MQVPEKNTTIVTLRVPNALHKAAKQKMLDDGGSFQSTLLALLNDWATGSLELSAPVEEHQGSRYREEKDLIEQALDLLPEYAASQITAIRALVESAPAYKVKHVPKKTATTKTIRNARSGR